jgi:hypothetical protein
LYVYRDGKAFFPGFLGFLRICKMKRSNVGAFVGQLRRWRKITPNGSKKQYLAVLRKGSWADKYSEEELAEMVEKHWSNPKKRKPAIKKAPKVSPRIQTCSGTEAKQQVLFAGISSEESVQTIVKALREVDDLPSHLRAAGVVNSDGSLNRRAIQRLINQAVYT